MKIYAFAIFAILAGTALAGADEFSADNGFGDHSPKPQVLTERGTLDHRSTGSIVERVERRPQSGYAVPIWLPFL